MNDDGAKCAVHLVSLAGSRQLPTSLGRLSCGNSFRRREGPFACIVIGDGALRRGF